MSVIRVNPEDVRAYAAFANERFEAIRGELESLTHQVATVHYVGPNAVQFKTRCGEMAAEFSNALLSDLGGIADAVSASTSAISSSLGGEPVNIAVNGSTVTPPPVEPGDGSVDIDTSALEALTPVVSQRLGALQDALAAHLNRLEGTDWQGTAKERAVEEVRGFTSTARGRSDEAQNSINAAIDQQISAVMSADR